MATTYEHIGQNKRRTVLLVLLFPLSFALFIWLCFSLFFWLGSSDSWRDVYLNNTYESADGYPYQQEVAEAGHSLHTSKDWVVPATNLMLKVLPFVWGVAMLWILIAYFMGDKMILSSAKATPITYDDAPDIYNLVENLCISRGLPVPLIYVIQDESLNAFATGRDPFHASIALTTGIMNRLERVELEGVIAHELAHVENRDIRLMLMTVAGISFFTFMGEIALRLSSSMSRRMRNQKSSGFPLLLFAVGGICLVYGYMIAPLIRLAVSRQREYQADATAALTTRNPRALASALAKISQDSRVEVLDNRKSMVAMCIANPLSKVGGLFSFLSGLYATHPPIEKRIQALLEMDRGI